jgi:Domain of unknown function (DUF5134)
MIGLGSLRWLLTVVFAAAAAFHLVRCVRPSSWPARVAEHRFSEVLHLVMGASMIVMMWPWGAVVPATVWVAVFTMSAGWFIAGAVGSAGRRLVPSFFASAMGAMVWMGASMPAQASTVHSHAGMAGMTMGGGAGHGSPGYTAWISVVLGGYLMLAAFWWLGKGLRVGGLSTVPRPLGWAALCHGVMSAGMALALLAMA